MYGGVTDWSWTYRAGRGRCLLFPFCVKGSESIAQSMTGVLTAGDAKAAQQEKFKSADFDPEGLKRKNINNVLPSPIWAIKQRTVVDLLCLILRIIDKISLIDYRNCDGLTLLCKCMMDSSTVAQQFVLRSMKSLVEFLFSVFLKNTEVYYPHLR